MAALPVEDDEHDIPSVFRVMTSDFVSCCDGHESKNHIIVMKFVALPHVFSVTVVAPDGMLITKYASPDGSPK